MNIPDKYKRTMAIVAASSNPIKAQEEVTMAIDTYMNDIAVTCPDCYWKLAIALHVAVEGDHFSETIARYAVDEMVHADGTKGEHFNAMESELMASSNSIDFNTANFNKWDWYYVLNMMYSDYCTYLTTNKDAYMNLAKLYLVDTDVPEGKAYKYWAYVVK